MQQSSRYRYVVLAAGVMAQATSGLVLQGLPSIAPQLRSEFGLGLVGIGLVLASVSVGLLVGLLPWGMLSDRIGERWVMSAGLLGAAGLFAVVAMTIPVGSTGSPVLLAFLLFLAGACSASVNAASGRAVLGWFPARQRGTAMGIRQTALPIGAAAAALTLPALVAGGVRTVFVAMAVVCAAATVVVAVLVRDPQTEDGGRGLVTASLRDPHIRRLTFVSAALTVPQFAVVAFLVLYLVEVHGFSGVAAGAILAGVQIAGGAARIVVGRLSDRAGSRLRPLVAVATATTAAFGALAATAWLDSALPVVILLVLAPVAISWNGLAFTAVGEIAPAGGVGTALALQNTAVALGSSLTPPALGAVVAHGSWPLAFGIAGASAGAGALLLLPALRSERTLPAPAEPTPLSVSRGADPR